MKNFNTSIGLESLSFGKYRRMGAFLTLFLLFFASNLKAQGGCGDMTPSFINYEPCKYRVQVVNTSDCFTPTITVFIDANAFETWSANTAGGWTGQELAPNIVELTHSGPTMPLGTSFPMIFTLPVGITTLGNFNWEYTCFPGESCTIFPGIELISCPDPMDASITGVKYRECGSLPYSNQPTIPGWPIQLLDADGNLIEEQVTDANGNYAFYDRKKGLYLVKEDGRMGWTSNIPASGQYTVDLAPSQQVERNFGNCPSCSCDSIYMDVVQLPFTNDTCTYTLSSINSGAYCFNSFNISISSGSFASVTPATGWTAVQLDSQHVQLDPPGDYLANGICPNWVIWTVTGSDNHQITVSTSWDDGGVPVSCSRVFSFQCPPPSSPSPCCPAGSSFGNELVTNGDFELGNQSFSNGYTYFNPGGPTMIGKYSVLNQSQVFSANSQWSAIDHSTFSATGKMLIVDGYGGTIAWQQTVNVTAGTNYSFSAWVNNLVRPPKDYADPQMSLFVDGSPIAGPLNLPETPDQWIRLCGTFTATATGPVVLSIRMLSTANIGNDVGIDDVSFRECIPPPSCQVSVNVTQNPDCTVTVCAVTTGPQPVAYQWCDGRTDDCFTTTQTPCVPTTYCVTATCSDGSTSSATVVYTVQDITPPMANCNLGIGVDLGTACTFQVTSAFVDGGSSDNCGIQSMSVNPTTLTACTNTIVTLTVTDWCGNTSTCTMGIQTTEGVPPIMTCPVNTTIIGTVGPNGLCTATYQPDKPPAIDNCDPSVTVTHNAPAVLISGGNTITWTATDDCGNTTTCVQIVTVDCCMACPAGNIVGPELVTNGDFESGFGFGSDYVIANSCSPGIYNVVTGPQLSGICGEWGGLDHTFNAAAGNMLAVDGSQTPGLAVWREQVPILANTNYTFCAYINNLNVPNFPDQPDPIVEVWLIGSNSLPGLIASYSLPEVPDAWININASWTSPNVPSPPYNLEIRTAGTSFGGNNFAVDDISFKSCAPSCTCGTYSDMSYRPSVGAPNVPVDCGDLIIWQCGLQNLQLGGNYMCQGPDCPSVIPMFWNLTGPGNGFVTSSTMSGPGFSVNIPSAYFTLPGLYTLTLGAICGMDTCYCEFTIETPGCDPFSCACPAGSTAGTNMITNGNFQLGNTGFTSAYNPLPPICSPKEYTVTDGNNVASLCNNWSCIDHTTGLLSGLFFVADGSQIIGDDAYRHPITLNQGTEYTLCAWVNNLNDTTLNADDPIVEAWILDASFVPIAGPIATTGSLPESPDVWVSLTTSWTATVTGNYYLAFRTSNTSFAGNNFALDDISFRSCSAVCCEDYDKFLAIAQNVQLFGTLGNCTLSFQATGLNDCMQISYNWGDGSGPQGPFVDNTLVTHTYPATGTYYVCYTIEEVNASGVVCWEYTHCDSVYVICDCATPPTGMVAWWPMDELLGDDNVADIVHFHEGEPKPNGLVGIPDGPDPVPGKVNGALHFVSVPGSTYVEVSNDPALNFGTGDFSIDAWINTNMGTQTEPIVDKLGNLNSGYSFSIQGTSPYYPTLVLGKGGTVQVLQSTTPIILGDWNLVAVTVGSQTATFYVCNSTGFFQSSATIIGAHNATNTRPLLIGNNPFNPHWNIMIDELEIFNRVINLAEVNAICSAGSFGKCKTIVAVDDPKQERQQIRIFPNPNPGTFNVELSEAATPGMSFRIIGLTGQLLREQTTQTGSIMQTVQAGDLPAGLYFLQVVLDGKVLTVEKFVKQ